MCWRNAACLRFTVERQLLYVRAAARNSIGDTAQPAAPARHGRQHDQQCKEIYDPKSHQDYLIVSVKARKQPLLSTQNIGLAESKPATSCTFCIGSEVSSGSETQRKGGARALP